MSDDDLLRTPEGELIRRARNRLIPKLSIPAAATQIGISAEHWGNIERGHKSQRAGEPPRRVGADALLLAKMAAAVGVTADLMETEGQRPDVAEEMRRGVPAAPVRTRVNPSMVRTPDLIPIIHEIAEELAAGEESSPSERAIWDSGMSAEEKWNLIAILRRENRSTARESERGAGLTPHLVVAGNPATRG